MGGQREARARAAEADIPVRVTVMAGASGIGARVGHGSGYARRARQTEGLKRRGHGRGSLTDRYMEGSILIRVTCVWLPVGYKRSALKLGDDRIGEILDRG
eukprot:6893729-Pyramimonas_sp.AAC.1